MPLYKFECDRCGEQDLREMTFEDHDIFKRLYPSGFAHAKTHCITGVFKQVYDFHFTRPMPEHYNHSLGQRVSNTAQVTSALSRQSDEASARMGFDHHYELVDPQDPASVGATDTGLEETERRAHNVAADGHKSTFS